MKNRKEGKRWESGGEIGKRREKGERWLKSERLETLIHWRHTGVISAPVTRAVCRERIGKPFSEFGFANALAQLPLDHWLQPPAQNLIL